jgi:hypothetical protein
VNEMNIIQDLEGEFNEDLKILKKNKFEILEMKSSISQIKDTVESLSNILD